MRKFAILIVLCLLLAIPAMAYEIPTDLSETSLHAEMEEFMDYYGLSEHNFSLSFYNTVTGESYSYNDQKIMTAASTFKLPLNMYFYELKQAGEITDEDFAQAGGLTLRDLQELSIVHSDDRATGVLLNYFPTYYQYREAMRKYLTVEDDALDSMYYEGSYYNTSMMMDILKYLYENRADFEVLIQDMKDATQQGYFKEGIKDYEIAHKFGSLPSQNNDVGIIYTPQPLLLAVYSATDSGARHCAVAAQIVTNYTIWQLENGEQESAGDTEPETLPEETVEPEDVTAQEPDPELQEKDAVEDSEEEKAEQEEEKKQDLVARMRASRFPWWVLGILALLLLVFLLRFL